MSHTDGSGELVAAWAAVQEGIPAVVRFEGDPSAALEPLAAHLVGTWACGRIPGGEPAILWFAGGPAADAAADVAVAAVAVMGVPWLVVVSGPRAHDRGVDYGLIVPGGRAGAVQPTRVEPLCADGPDAMEAAAVEAARDGRICEASALIDALAEQAPERAAPHRWMHVARSFYLARGDVLDVARREMADPGPGLSSVLTFAGQSTPDPRVSLHLLRQGLRTAQTDAERQDATYYRNRAEISLGQRAASDAGEPYHPLMLAMARFGPATRAAYRSKEPGPAHQALDAVGTAAARALSAWVHLRYDMKNGDWDGAAAGLMALGLVRSAGWLLAESVQLRPTQTGVREGIDRLHAPRLSRAVEMTLLLDAFDAERAARLAPELLRPDNNVALRCYGYVMQAASAAVLHDDPKPLAQLHRPEIREQLQESFCRILATAALQSGPATKPRLLAIAADWAAHVESLAEVRQGWLETLRSLRPPRIPLGPYELDGQLDQGGMGAVWIGEHTRLGQAVAVKLVLREALVHRQAFEEEVELLATLDHPAVVQVLDLGEVTEATEALSGGQLVAGTPYLVMEFVPGGTLTDHRGTLPWADVRDLLLALLDALAYVHARGILHRDLKPQNVLVGESAEGLYVRLSDFGLSGAGMKGQVAGTPAYMAPEQFTGVGLGPWSDLYAVGCIATALLAGLPPFLGSASQLVRAHRTRPVPPLEASVPVPEGFEAWRLKMLAKAPEDRFPNARAASLALRVLPDPAPVEVPAEEPARPDDTTFVYETLVGLPADDSDAIRPSQVGFRTILPRRGFVQRPLRPRLPTDRLFGRFPSPCVGQMAVRQAIWDAATEAYAGEALRTLDVRVPPGLSLDRSLDWARRRLRELGVDASADDTGDFRLAEEPVDRAPGLYVRRSDAAALSLHRLGPLETVAQIRLQVDVTPDLAWALSRRTHGLPALVDLLLAAVIRHPGLLPSDAGLVAGGPLPALLKQEKAFWESVLAGLSDAERAAIDRAAVQPPGWWVPLDATGVPSDLLAGDGWLAIGLREHLAVELEESGRAEGLHRAELDAATGLLRGWHLLGAGEPALAEPLLRAALPHPAAAEALARCLDLQLVPAGDPRRQAATSDVPLPDPAVAVERLLAGDARGAVVRARADLERLLALGAGEGRPTLEAVVLAATAGNDDLEWESLLQTASPAFTAALLEAAVANAARAGRDDRVERLERSAGAIR